MQRRDFIKIGATGLAANFVAASVLKSSLFAQQDKSTVWETQGAASVSVKALFNALGGLDKLVTGDPGKAIVLIKPNLCVAAPSDRATTTSPAVIEALCDYLTTSGVKKIIITDHTLREATTKPQQYRIAEISEKYPQVKFILANQQRFYKPVPVQGKVLKEVQILKMLSRANLVINLATAKHHSATHVSLSIKNLMGMIWDRTAFHTQLDLSQAIGDLALAIRPHIHLVDASRILLNQGPIGPGPVATDDRLFAAFDPVALDAVVVSRYNFGGKSLSAREISHIRAAHRNGVGEIDLNKIEQIKIEA